MSGRDANQLAADATTARRGIISALIAVKRHLDQPYPDDDRWTPWSRFVEPALDRLDESVKALVALVGTLQQERDYLRDRGDKNARRAQAAEAALAETRQALTEIGNANVFHAKAIARRALADTGGDTAETTCEHYWWKTPGGWECANCTSTDGPGPPPLPRIQAPPGRLT